VNMNGAKLGNAMLPSLDELAFVCPEFGFLRNEFGRCEILSFGYIRQSGAGNSSSLKIGSPRFMFLKRVAVCQRGFAASQSS
jgi:hypothetical protein